MKVLNKKYIIAGKEVIVLSNRSNARMHYQRMIQTPKSVMIKQGKFSLEVYLKRLQKVAHF